MINNDPRFLRNGIEIPTAGGYADQPSIIVLSDGTFVCATTCTYPISSDVCP